MKNLTFLFCFVINICFGQNLIPTDNDAIIHLMLKDSYSNPLQSMVTFKSKNKEYSFQTDVNGLIEIIVRTGEDYKISIPNSNSSYDYEIIDFPGQVLDLSLAFDMVNYKQNVATASKALLILSAFNLPKGKEIEIIEEPSKTKCIVTKQDSLKITLPINKSYRIKISGYKIKNDLIKIDNTPANVLYYVLYIENSNVATLYKSNNETFFNVIYTNIYTKLPIPEEKIEVVGNKGQKVYKGKTSQNGTCLFIVPNNDSYFISISQAKNVISTRIGSNKPINLFDCKILFPSTKEILMRKKEDSLRLVKRDLEYKKLSTVEIRDNKKGLKNEVITEAEQIKLRIKENPKYFQQSNNVVCAVLYRLQKRWNSKMIVTDLTGSMYPYMKQLLLWHSLKMMTNEKNDYVFFNDGDNKPDYTKVIGSTGGLYYTDSDSTEIIIGKMLETMNKGSGGDGPENDIEALIYAQSKKKTFSELILIADNYAPVKDISLLEQLNVPIRIILCGTNWGINTDYIEIAYKTKGSIHTIEEDIMTLGNLVDGNALKIGNKTYIYSRGKFFEQK